MLKPLMMGSTMRAAPSTMSSGGTRGAIAAARAEITRMMEQNAAEQRVEVPASHAANDPTDDRIEALRDLLQPYRSHHTLSRPPIIT